MKGKNGIILLMAICCASCEGDKIDQSLEKTQFHINALISKSETKMTDDTWINGDAIGIYTKKSEETLSSGGLKSNVKYINGNGATFLPAKEGEAIQLPSEGDNIDFIGYYPYQEKIDVFSYAVDVSNQTNQAAIDLLFSDNETNRSAENTDVKMIFKHQLSRIILQISAEDSEMGLSGLQATMTNAARKASFSLNDATLSAPTATGDIPFNVAADGKTAVAIVLPDNDLSDNLLILIIDQIEYKYSLSLSTKIKTFEKGCKYTYMITLNEKEKTITVDVNSSIDTWTEGPSETVALDPSDKPVIPTIGDGSEENPYTVSDAKSRQGGTDVWVKGYIVGCFNGSVKKFINTTEGAVASNLALADSPTETEAANTFPVELENGKNRTALNLVDHPENFKKEVMVEGDLEKYFSLPGIKSLSAYKFVK
ncbi:MAG TPA: hypothetical protein DDW85_07495 [Porphyromonadaceae bacterium]|nr:hypothetical protein [Porphyromonadaceae bacterium]